jgi:hypothetical protein
MDLDIFHGYMQDALGNQGQFHIQVWVVFRSWFLVNQCTHPDKYKQVHDLQLGSLR